MTSSNRRGHFIPVSACKLCIWTVKIYRRVGMIVELWSSYTAVHFVRIIWRYAYYGRRPGARFFPPRLFQQLCGFLRLLDCSLLPSSPIGALPRPPLLLLPSVRRNRARVHAYATLGVWWSQEKKNWLCVVGIHLKQESVLSSKALRPSLGYMHFYNRH